MIIATLLRVNWLKLKRDYVALALTFILPIIFFSIFASIFGALAAEGEGPGVTLAVIVVDEDDSEVSRDFARAIGEQSALRVVVTDGAQRYQRATALAQVRSGAYPLAVIIPHGFAATFADFSARPAPLELIYDATDPSARFIVSGLLQSAALDIAPDILLARGLARLERSSADLTPAQRQTLASLLPLLRATGTRRPAGVRTQLVPVITVNVRGAESTPIAYYAAGIGVMFLLFSMVGASGSLLQEEESGTLERVLNANIGIGTLIIANWLFFTAVGCAQVSVMFLWAALAFGLDLWSVPRLGGGLVMTVVTAATAAAFGLILATLCKTRAQLNGVSSILILLMSALGGSMIPRFAMPPVMETLGLFTLNGWALDGYLKVFWTAAPDAILGQLLLALWPQLLALSLLLLVFLGGALLLARRWESA